MQPQMRDDEIRLADDAAAKKKNVKIEWAIRPPKSRSPAEPCLDRLADPQQLMGCQRGLQANGCVEEDLARCPDRNRAPDATDRSELNLRMSIQCLERELEQRTPITKGAPQTDDRCLSQIAPTVP